MRTTLKFLAVSAIALMASACTTAIADAPEAQSAPVQTSATVKIVLDGGHGSGVHIGGGYFLTAGHVTDGTQWVEVKSRDGAAAKGEVLWRNFQPGGYDVSLVYAPEAKGLATAGLSCAPVHVGQTVHAEGNPIGAEFVTTWGRVAGTGKTGAEASYGEVWRELAILDLSGAGGMSGGPVYDDASGAVVGMIVAGYGQVSPFMMMVPGKTLCHVMGRAV